MYVICSFTRTILSTSSTAQGSGGSFKDRKLYLLVVTPNTLLKQEGLQLAEASFPYVMMSCLYILQEYHDNMSARVMLTRCKPSTNVQARPRSTSTVVAFCLEISLPASDAFNIFNEARASGHHDLGGSSEILQTSFEAMRC